MIQQGDVIRFGKRHYEVITVYGFSVMGLHLQLKRITSRQDDEEQVTSGIPYDYCIPLENLRPENYKNCIIEIGNQRIGEKVFEGSYDYADKY